MATMNIARAVGALLMACVLLGGNAVAQAPPQEREGLLGGLLGALGGAAGGMGSRGGSGGGIGDMLGGLAGGGGLGGLAKMLGLGSTDPKNMSEDDAAKLKRLKDLLKASWKDTHPIPWEWFSGVYFNPRDQERKPKPYLFEKAHHLAWPCPAIYESEANDEVESARHSGLKGYVIGIPGKPAFLPVASIPGLVERVQTP